MSAEFEKLKQLARQPGISPDDRKALADMTLDLPGDESIEALRDQAELGHIVREQGQKALQLAQRTEAEIISAQQAEHWSASSHLRDS